MIYEAQADYTEMDLASLPELGDQKTLYRMTLTVYDGRSTYTRDSLLLLTPRSGGLELWPYEQVYKVYSTDMWLKTGAGYKSGYAYASTLSARRRRSNFAWQATGREREIAGVACIEVSSGDDIAWYAPSIAVPDGPQDGCFGLPGLVLSLYLPGSGSWEAFGVSFEASPIATPALTLSNVERDVKLDPLEIPEVGFGVIRVDQNTPVAKWVSFQN